MNPKKKFVLFVIFIVISILVAIFSGFLGQSFSLLSSFVSANPVSSIFIYTILFIVLASFSFSVSVMTSAGVFFFSEPEVIIYSMIGIMGSSIVHFFISKKLGREYIREYLNKRGGRLERFDEIVEKNPFKTILLLSAIFFVPPTIPNLLGGVIKISFKNFCIATFFGNLLNTVFTVYLIKGIFYSNVPEMYSSLIGLIVVTLVSLYFYKGEIKNILKISFPWAFKQKILS